MVENHPLSQYRREVQIYVSFPSAYSEIRCVFQVLERRTFSSGLDDDASLTALEGVIRLAVGSCFVLIGIAAFLVGFFSSAGEEELLTDGSLPDFVVEDASAAFAAALSFSSLFGLISLLLAFGLALLQSSIPDAFVFGIGTGLSSFLTSTGVSFTSAFASSFSFCSAFGEGLRGGGSLDFDEDATAFTRFPTYRRVFRWSRTEMCVETHRDMCPTDSTQCDGRVNSCRLVCFVCFTSRLAYKSCILQGRQSVGTTCNMSHVRAAARGKDYKHAPRIYADNTTWQLWRMLSITRDEHDQCSPSNSCSATRVIRVWGTSSSSDSSSTGTSSMSISSPLT